MYIEKYAVEGKIVDWIIDCIYDQTDEYKITSRYWKKHRLEKDNIEQINIIKGETAIKQINDIGLLCTNLIISSEYYFFCNDEGYLRAIAIRNIDMKDIIGSFAVYCGAHAKAIYAFNTARFSNNKTVDKHIIRMCKLWSNKKGVGHYAAIVNNYVFVDEDCKTSSTTDIYYIALAKCLEAIEENNVEVFVSSTYNSECRTPTEKAIINIPNMTEHELSTANKYLQKVAAILKEKNLTIVYSTKYRIVSDSY